ncbi:MAG TPA: hypothetical protein VKV27_06205 [Solirubrobacteraceae bacterium]|nr:hypothetical protein [Solirubrobacteraceae bacterium]
MSPLLAGVRSHRLALAGCLLVAAGAALGGCGGQSGSDAARSAAGADIRYLKGVDAVEAALALPLGSVTRVTKQLGARGARPELAEQRALQAALAQIQALQVRLARLRAPAAAAHLRNALLALVGGEADLTRQTEMLVAFLPAYGAVLSALAPATSRLARVLAANRATTAAAVRALYARKARALLAFRATIAGVLAALARLRPPPVSLAGWRAQIGSLRGMAGAARALAAALRSGAARKIPSLVRQLDAAAIAGRTLAVQRAQRAAIRAYDARLVALQQLSAAAQQARDQLAAKLG